MKQLITIVFFIICSCTGKSGLTEKIMTLKDSCNSIDYQLDTLKRGNEKRQNLLFYSSQAKGVDKLVEDAHALNDTAKHRVFMTTQIQYLTIKDSLEAIKKQYLREIDSLQLELKE